MSPGNGNGSIPACAGEPVYDFVTVGLYGVYPRVCGGTYVSLPQAIPRYGLSPRVRGNRWKAMQSLALHRSIPACAGEPIGDTHTGNLSGVYPRVCGGTFRTELLPTNATGLSPRVRGNLVDVVRDERVHGSIPACAGEPHPVIDRLRLDEVYPRVCGGTRSRCGGCYRPWGLSPRVRGNLEEALLGVQEKGSIPACAGEPRPTP